MDKLGLSGRLARVFLTSEITPLLALAGVLLGIFAILVTPREEEPQINVTFANVFIPFPGASSAEVEHLVSGPAEQVLSELEGVEHIYSVSLPGQSVLTVRFRVGEDRTRAIVRLYNALFSKRDWLPEHLGVLQPIVKPKGIDDVPIVALTLWSEEKGAYELSKVAHAIEAELKRVQGTRDIYTLGGPDEVVYVELDPVRMAGFGIAVEDLKRALQLANTSAQAGELVDDNRALLVQAGRFLSRPEEVGDLVVGVYRGAPVYLRDVAEVRLGPETPKRYAWFGTGPAFDGSKGTFPAVTVAVAKQPGTNAVTIAERIIERFKQIQGIFIPEGVNVTVTRNYGATADEKAEKLIHKLLFATSAVVVLVLLALGWREAIIVGLAITVTLLLTLFASWAWGFTLNRVSLFALIFAIGILVDDAIVVVENIHRHLQMGARRLLEAIPVAVDEVGGPTILATFTVIAALLPMAFVTGLMGPYMSPIPINASIGMVLSLLVAFTFTPWLAQRLLGGELKHHGKEKDRLYGLFRRALMPFLKGEKGRWARWALLLAVLLFTFAALGLVAVRLVILKMLPFDNKSEFQIVVDMPEGTPLEQTARVLSALGAHLETVPEVTHYQAYAGTASPINFNGLVRQYYLRSEPHMGDIQVNLLDKHHRERKSHDIARDLRAPLQAIGARFGANVKIVEMPPGPPVQSPIVAEIYGLDYPAQRRIALKLAQLFQGTPDIVDVDTSVEAEQPKANLKVKREKAALFGIAQSQVVDAIQSALGGLDASFLHRSHRKYPLPIRIQLPADERSSLDALLALRLRSSSGALVPLSEFVDIEEDIRDFAIYHKDLLPVTFVTADMAGEIDSPLYGMAELVEKLEKLPMEGDTPLRQFFVHLPDNPYDYSLKWDGEWQVTYETFRDMGIAYAVGLVLIYLLVVGQFRSYLVPLIIMAPIPLTLIGVMPGHALLGAKFTATSMIGMIALAGIIVRNSILMVDFINQHVKEGMPFEEAVIRSGSVRAKPIVLTGLAAMLGAFFILDDPIFSGLAISLIFGIFASTLLTLAVIPVMYYAFRYKHLERIVP